MHFDLEWKHLPGKNTQKVNKQKFVAKIGDSYWLFVWGERDNGHSDLGNVYLLVLSKATG